MADDKDKKIPEVPHLENLTGKEKIPVSANGEPRYVEVEQIVEKTIPNVKAAPARNQILYVTNDANSIEPYSNTTSQIASNEYYPKLGYGIVTLAKDGTNGLELPPIFRSNTNLLFVWIGNSISKIKDYAFDGCTNLIEVLGQGSGHTISLYSSAFQNCTNLKRLTNLGIGLSSDATYVFSNCSHFEMEITFNCGKNGTFNGCKSIKKAIFNATYPSGTNRFKGCSSLDFLIIDAPYYYNEFEGTTPRYIEVKQFSSLADASILPPPDKLETLILNFNFVIPKLAEYASTFSTPADGRGNIEIPIERPVQENGVETLDMPTTIAAYIGTPNNWLKIYVPENLLKAYQERYPTLKNHFHPITGEDIYATKDEVNDAKKAVFIDLWNDACGIWGKYNEETGFFELNGLTDITYEEALKIYNFPRQTSSDIRNFYGYSSIRTNIPGFSYLNNNGSSANNLIANGAFQNSKLEVVNLSYYNNFQPEYPIKLQYEAKASTGVFYENPNLVRIIHPFRITAFGTVSDLFWKQIITFNPKLESFQLHYIDRDIWFTGCPKINLESFQWMITNARNTDAITITVEEGIYLALTGEAEYPFNGGTQEEWEQLLQDAIAKQISFATI